MTRQNDYILTSALAAKGWEAVHELLRVLIINAMQVERAKGAAEGAPGAVQAAARRHDLSNNL